MKINHSLKMMAASLIAFVLLNYACKKDIRPPASDVPGATGTTARAATGPVNVFLTKGDKSALLAQSTVSFAADSGTNTNTITVDEGVTYQGIDGFGFTLTGGSASLLNGLGGNKAAVLNELFGTGNGQIGISYLRISIGASDLSSSDFTYNQTSGDVNMNNFSLAQENTDFLPILKAILAINPNIKILATPWTAPTWMKVNTTGNNGYTGGSLNTAYYDAYARYFVKYIQAMQAQGITIDAITPQNEPLNPYNNPSMVMQANEEVNFINNNLGPQLRNAGLNTKIIAYDHNTDVPSYATTVVGNAGQYVDGSAFHLYAGNISTLTDVHNAYPSKNVYFTEQWVGAPSNFGGDLGWHINTLIIGATRNWSRNVLEWNLAADPNNNPHTNGGCSTCLGGITVSGTSITRNVGYYIVAHASKFVRPGAVRISSNIAGSIQNVAFKNSDDSKVLIASNSGNGDVNFKVKWGNQSFSYTLAAGAVATFKWTGTPGSGGSGAPIGSTITLKGFNNQYVNSQNGTQAMTCSSATASTWEQFTVVDAGAGKIALRAMNKYVSSENGTQAITCSRTTIGDWEKFDWVPTADGKITFRGNNGKFISSENGTQAMTCTRATASGWEAFGINQ
ncbi:MULTISPECIES: glycoside hydrolase family 30 beta sandwich domain-containing protein [unclassified Mucilaginibacter]|uniref:glycoside hydrolase family 30 beta sandwich domain-containing protein n=2 Tax=Mucilaginibacter TaxID=423349 RepID=UPI002AC9A53C|nr:MULTISPECIES: glycoside hydrolase family 30 beta sandwich domain-containing protein [unclassified Mucilaginibacter]MEB0260100.1 glycoside hydrolase family 30 beta sandwich domain-containing protein [Mucilaginibacter sp. 10I4]MEB0279178.1 glycoside hydrolase family 30 beta sandwich domain-containing protein [Mucilaginibacter sp. 10B2]WPX22357.1 glycoside hydrolase family 30 beta sandwich domain-containing protein [Mucilaginibacter sp. 5C4]